MPGKLLLSLTIMLAATAAAAAQQAAPADGREADRAAIRAHVESIFRAFIDKDARKLRDTHAAN